MIPETVLAYAAGIIDGEAHVGIKRDRPSGKRRTTSYTPELKVEMVDEDLIRWLHTTFGGRMRGPRLSRGGTRPVYVWALLGKDAVAMLELVEQYLIVKRRHAMLIIDFWTQRLRTAGGKPVPPDEMMRRASYYEAVKLLNYSPRDPVYAPD